MYIPKSKYSAPKHTPGKEFTLNGEEYVGWYVELNSGGYLTGKAVSSESKKLIFNPEALDSEILTSSSKYLLFNMDVKPSPNDKSNKKWVRYFLQDKRTYKIVEVNKARYNSFRSKNYITRISITWDLKGPAENLMINGYPYEGAASKNKRAVEAVENQIPGLSKFIKDYSQFVE